MEIHWFKKSLDTHSYLYVMWAMGKLSGEMVQPGACIAVSEQRQALPRQKARGCPLVDSVLKAPRSRSSQTILNLPICQHLDIVTNCWSSVPTLSWDFCINHAFLFSVFEMLRRLGSCWPWKDSQGQPIPEMARLASKCALHMQCSQSKGHALTQFLISSHAQPLFPCSNPAGPGVRQLGTAPVLCKSRSEDACSPFPLTPSVCLLTDPGSSRGALHGLPCPLFLGGVWV